MFQFEVPSEQLPFELLDFAPAHIEDLLPVEDEFASLDEDDGEAALERFWMTGAFDY